MIMIVRCRNRVVSVCMSGVNMRRYAVESGPDHVEITGSEQARRILEGWKDIAGKFVKVMPIDYRKALQRLREREQARTEFTPATEEVFRG